MQQTVNATTSTVNMDGLYPVSSCVNHCKLEGALDQLYWTDNFADTGTFFVS